MALSVPISHPGYFVFGASQDAIVDTDVKSLLFAFVGSPDTAVIGTHTLGVDGVLTPAVTSTHVLQQVYVSGTKQATLEVFDRATGQKTSLYVVDTVQVGNITSTALSAKYAFAVTKTGLLRVDLGTSEGKTMTSGPLECDRPEALGGVVVCSNLVKGGLQVIDQETGAVSSMSPTASLQVGGRCARDGAACVWVDYRDPPGTSSGYDTRQGGEIYRKDMKSGAVVRVTSDSPGAPTPKVSPSIDGDLTVWLEFADPVHADVLNAMTLLGAKTLVRLDGQGKRCRWKDAGFAAPVLFGRHIIASWLDPKAGMVRLVNVDLDAPGIPWECL